MPRDLFPGAKQPIDLLEKPDKQIEYGSVLPVVREDGKTKWDLRGGITGMIGRAVSLPGEAMRGEVDPLSGEGIQRAMEAAAIMTPVGAAYRAGASAFGSPLRPRKQTVPPVPSGATLKKVGKAGYKAANEMGVEFESSAVADMAQSARMALEKEGFFAELAPKSFSLLERLASPPANSVARLAQIDAARKALRKAAQDFNNPTEQAVAANIIKRIDEFVEKPDPAAVVAGPAAAAAKLQKFARGNYAAAKRSEAVAGIGADALDAAKAANSGRNIGNTVRRSTASFLKKPKKVSGFSAPEKEALRKVAQGSFMANRTRDIGHLFGGGGGLGSLATGAFGAAAGGAAGGPGGAALGTILPMMVGQLAKGATNRITMRALRDADNVVRQRSPLYQDMLANAPYDATNGGSRAALMRALIALRQPENR